MTDTTRATEALHTLLLSAASRFPDRPAVLSDGAELSYSELHTLSDNVAATLQACGVKKGDRVGIYLPKSASSIISVYSILKCGGVYVPFDPEAPPERLAYIAKNCGIKVVLTNSAKARAVEGISKGASVSYVILVDHDIRATSDTGPYEASSVSIVPWEEASVRGAPRMVPVAGDDLAYILYTSGSTGVPKGVTISHRNSKAFVDWAADWMELSPDDVVACHAPLHFDISTFSIFSTCRAGGCVLMVPDKASVFPAELSSLVERAGVTVWYSVPSVLVLLTLYGSLAKRDLSRLRAIIFAGEVFPMKHLRELISAVPNARYINWYGPTETNVCTSYEVLSGGGEMTAVPIGKPCPYADALVMADDGRIASRQGEVGELYVGGPTVMKGYWGDAERTARLLVHDPRGRGRPDLMYKTGDLVTFDAEGNFLYLGRRDGMVKTRGYRVELGEVEAAIYLHHSVKEAVVVPVPDDLVGNRLHAFISTREGETLTRGDVQAFCATRLPKYMIPDGISFMKSLPKTSNGKMDRVSLAKMTAEGVPGA